MSVSQYISEKWSWPGILRKGLWKWKRMRQAMTETEDNSAGGEIQCLSKAFWNHSWGLSIVSLERYQLCTWNVMLYRDMCMFKHFQLDMSKLNWNWANECIKWHFTIVWNNIWWCENWIRCELHEIGVCRGTFLSFVEMTWASCQEKHLEVLLMSLKWWSLFLLLLLSH